MTEVRFYHMTNTTLESALPVMLERALSRGQRALVQCGSTERAESLANHLWTYDEAGFLPHGTAKDGRAEDQPIWLTAEDATAPNGADVLFLADGATSAHLADYALCAVLFDGRDDAVLADSRELWKQLKAAGHEMSYWQQDEREAWGKKA
jgi:DNA polymerase-3 subunit chi